MSKAKETSQITSKLLSDVGSLVTADSDSLELLSPGADGQVLTADSSASKGIKWASPGSSGLSSEQITDLTDSGDSTLHYHATDRALSSATGTLAVSNGGTGQTTVQAAINALTVVSAASAGQVLTKSGSDATWVSPAGAGLGDVSTTGSAVANNLVAYNDTSGDVIKDSGIPLANVADKASAQTFTNKAMSTGSTWAGTKIGPTVGGTDQTSWTKGDVLYASATNTLSKLAIGTVGQCLQTSSGGLPSWVDPLTVGTTTGDDSVWFGSSNIGWSDTTGGSLLKIGQGSSGSPSSSANTPLWVQNWTSADISGHHFGSSTYIETIKSSGNSTPNVLTVQATVTGGSGGSVGIHGRTDIHSDMAGIHTGIWAASLSPEGDTTLSGTYCGLEINTFNRSGSALSSKDRKNSGSILGLLVYNYVANADGSENFGSARPNHFGIVVEGSNSNSYYTGMLIEDFSLYGIHLIGTQTATYGIRFSQEAGILGTGISFNTQCSTAGISLGDNKINWGSSTQTVSSEGDMLYNASSNILYFNQGGTTTEVLAGTGIGTSASYTAERKLSVKFNGTTYYLLASTTA